MIPETFPTVFLDRAFFALRRHGQMVIHLEMRFDHGIDRSRLDRALSLVMDAEPILGCRLDRGSELGQWVRLADSDRGELRCLDDEAAVPPWMAEAVDPERGPLVAAALLSGVGGDTLLLKVAHEVADASAVKRIARQLGSIYERLEKEPEHVPTPNVDGSRSIDQLTRQIPWTAKPSILASVVGQVALQGASGPCRTVSLEEEDQLEPTYLRRALSADQTAHLVELGKECEATVNDCGVAAFLRALARQSEGQADRMLALAMSVDLRRYLPEGDTGGICNLSNVEGLTLGKRLESGFEETVMRVSAITRRRKDRWMGVGPYGTAMVGSMKKMSLDKYQRLLDRQWESMRRKEKLPPTLTNMGVIEGVSFGGPPEEAHLLVPASYPPSLAFGLSGYRGTLTVSTVGYPKSRGPMEELLEAIVAELTT